MAALPDIGGVLWSTPQSLDEGKQEGTEVIRAETIENSLET